MSADVETGPTPYTRAARVELPAHKRASLSPGHGTHVLEGGAPEAPPCRALLTLTAQVTAQLPPRARGLVIGFELAPAWSGDPAVQLDPIAFFGSGFPRVVAGAIATTIVEPGSKPRVGLVVHQVGGDAGGVVTAAELRVLVVERGAEPGPAAAELAPIAVSPADPEGPTPAPPGCDE